MPVKKTVSILAIPAVFFLDRFFKILIVRTFPEGGGFAVLPGILYITRVSNTGAAFGMLKHSGLLLVLASAGAIFFLALGLLRDRNPWPWALVMAGALGNLYDRLRFGFVIDFLDLRVWPVFNVADISICVGVGLLLLGLVRKHGYF